MVLEETLDRSHTTLARPINQKYLAAQSNVCLPFKAHNLATQLTFHFKGSFSGINYIYKIAFKILKQRRYFFKRFPHSPRSSFCLRLLSSQFIFLLLP